MVTQAVYSETPGTTIQTYKAPCDSANVNMSCSYKGMMQYRKTHLLKAHAIDLGIAGCCQEEAGEVAAHKLPIWAAGHIQDVAVCVIGRLQTHTIHERVACNTPIH